MLCMIFLMHEARQRGHEQKGSDHLFNLIFCARCLVWIRLVYNATSHLHIARSDVTSQGHIVNCQVAEATGDIASSHRRRRCHIVTYQATARQRLVGSRPLRHRLGRTLGAPSGTIGHEVVQPGAPKNKPKTGSLYEPVFWARVESPTVVCLFMRAATQNFAA